MDYGFDFGRWDTSSRALIEWAEAVRKGNLIPPPMLPVELFLKTIERIGVLEDAINKVLDDEEANTGWGPDVTTVAYLRKAVGRNVP